MSLILDKIENYSSPASVFTVYHKILLNLFVKPLIKTNSSNLGLRGLVLQHNEHFSKFYSVHFTSNFAFDV